jgi:DNA polymerase-1
MNLLRHEIYITNTNKCKPPGENKATLKQIRTCRDLYLRKELEIVSPKVVLLLGAKALQGWLDRSDGATIGTNRGKDLNQGGEYRVFVTYHPAAILRSPTRLEPTLEDFSGVVQQLEGTSHRPKGRPGKYHVFGRSKKIDHDFINTVGLYNKMSVDVETTGLDMFDPKTKLLSVNVTQEPKTAVVVPVKRIDESTLASALASEGTCKIMHYAQFDCKVLRAKGYPVGGKIFDTQVALHLLDENAPSTSLESAAIYELDVPPWKTKPVSEMSKEELVEYGGRDSDYTYRLAHRYAPRLKEEGLWPLFKVQMQLVRALTDMEMSGVQIDTEVFGELNEEYERKMDRISRYIRARHGPVNLRSGDQLRPILYDDLGLPVIRRTKGKRKPATDIKTLEQLELWAKTHEAKRTIQGIIAYKHLSKLVDAFITKLPNHIKPDGRIHPQFHLDRSVTRLSCSNPNMQQLPKKVDPSIRRMVVSRFEGGCIMSADYDQAELRMLAHVSRDPVLLDTFRKDIDIHTKTASGAFGVPISRVTKKQRDEGKTTNFLILFGGGHKRLASQIGCSETKAQKLINRWFGQYQGATEWIKGTRERLIKHGEVVNPFGRKRRLIILKPGTYDAERSLRQGVNAVIQSGAFDLLTLALVRIWQEMKARGLKSRPILQIHDEIVFDVAKYEKKYVADIVRRHMTNPPIKKLFGFTFLVPLKCEISTGANWMEQEVMDG